MMQRNSQEKSSAAGASVKELTEIEVTSAMIEAGALVLAAFDTTFCGEAVWAERVYKAMRKAASDSF